MFHLTSSAQMASLAKLTWFYYHSFQQTINSNETQASHIFFFNLLFMLGNYEPTCIVTLKMVTM